MVDYGPLLNPDDEPSSCRMTAIDFSSWAFPILSAILATAGGCVALNKIDRWAAGLSIASGIFGAVGVLATNKASRVRDHRIERAKSLAQVSADTTEYIQCGLPSDWP